jgi:hypothetical protein
MLTVFGSSIPIAAAVAVDCGRAEVARRANLTNTSGSLNGTFDGNETVVTEPEVNISKCEVADIISWAVRPFHSAPRALSTGGPASKSIR